MKRILSLTAALAVTLAASAAESKFDNRSRLMLDGIGSGRVLSRSGDVVSAFIAHDATVNASDLMECGLEVRAFGPATAVVAGSVEALGRASSLDGVSKVSLASPMALSNDLSRAETHADALLNPPGVEGSTYSGFGVIAGIFDTGFDLQHPAFRADGRSRVEKLWFYPENNCESMEEVEGDALDTFTTENPDDTHGTHVLGTMSGHYEGSAYNGYAPGASIAIGCGSLYDANIADGVARIAEYARSQGKPCVINLSISDFTGPRDGRDLFSRSLSESTAGSGDAILVVAAGNDNTAGHSISKVLDASDPAVRTIIAPEMWRAKGNGVLSVWGGDSRPFKVTLVMYDRDEKKLYSQYTLEEGEEKALYLATDDFNDAPDEIEFIRDAAFSRAYDNSYIAAYYEPHTTSDRPNCLIGYDLSLSLTDNAQAYLALGVIVEGSPGQRIDINLSGTTTTLHSGWMEGWSMGGNDCTISSMACADGVISVGACITRPKWTNINGKAMGWDDTFVPGDISPWSSRGTVVDGRTLPLVAAPGVGVLSTISTPYMEAHPEADDPVMKVDRTGRTDYWGGASGTSMATPAVAGGIALWLEADPSLTAAEVIDIIEKTARTDSHTEANPDAWGAGKFDAEAGLREVLRRKASLAGPSAVAPGGMMLKDNGNTLEVQVPGHEEFAVAVYNLAGVVVARGEADGGIAVIDTSRLGRGVYVLNAAGESKRYLK